MSRKYLIWTFGCQMNEADSRHLGSELEALGFTAAGDAAEADLVILNTCVVRQQAEDKAVSRLGVLKQAKTLRPGMTIGLMGCMVGMREAPELKARFPFVDVFMPPSDTSPLLEYLDAKGLHELPLAVERSARSLREAIQNEEYTLPAGARGRAVTAHVPVVLGCSHACTFCVIPYRRGAERSRPREEVLREIRALVEQGVREVMLLGQIVDRYGLDLDPPCDLADLLREVASLKGLLRIRFLTSHPNWMTDKLIDTVARVEKICPQFEVPVQAGNDEVLQRMRRGYTSAEYRRVVERIRARIPGAAVHTDIIVGFPGETAEQFMDTCRLIEDLRLDKVHIAKYSERPKTIAARQMPDDVPAEEKERRYRELEQLQESILETRHRSLRGCRVEILVEDKQKGRWRGRTPEGTLVFFDDTGDWRGRLVEVEVEWTGPYSLIGAPVSSVAAEPAFAV